MKNRATNTLAYTGIVTLSQYVGKKKIKLAQKHNTGCGALFEFFADCLLGDFTLAKINQPAKIMFIKRQIIGSDGRGNNAYSHKQTSGFFLIRSKPEKIISDGQSRVRYSFTIPRDQLTSIINDSTDVGIGLFSAYATAENISDYSAFCEIDLSGNNFLNTALVIDWDLVISNQTAVNTD